MNNKSFKITIVVNGKPEGVEVTLDEQIGKAVKDALEQSGNSGQPAEQWELRDAAGQVLDTGKKIGESGIGPGARLFLSLKAGVGGGSV